MTIIMRHHESIFTAQKASIISIFYLRRYFAHTWLRYALGIYTYSVFSKCNSIVRIILNFRRINVWIILYWTIYVFLSVICCAISHILILKLLFHIVKIFWWIISIFIIIHCWYCMIPVWRALVSRWLLNCGKFIDTVICYWLTLFWNEAWVSDKSIVLRCLL